MTTPARPVQGATIETAWGQAVHDAVIASDGRLTDAALSAAYGRVASPTPEAFNRPLVTNDAIVNPTLVCGVDPTSGIVFGVDRPTNGLSMSANHGAWNVIWEGFIHDGWVYFGARRFPAIAA